MSGQIHPTAIVDASAELAEDVEIGPYAVVGADVRIGAGTSVGSHAVIEGPAWIGEGNRIYPHAVVGGPPQDLRYAGERTELRIGDRNQIREFTTINRGTVNGGGVTTIGSDNLFMNFSHVAHDCRIENHCVLANAATLAGHVLVGDHAIVGGLAAIHQFVRIGESVMLGGGAMVNQDVPPYCIAQGDRATLAGLNLVGLRRRGHSDEAIRALRRAYGELFRMAEPFRETLARLESEAESQPEEVRRFVAFVAASERGVCRPRRAGEGSSTGS